MPTLYHFFIDKGGIVQVEDVIKFPPGLLFIVVITQTGFARQQVDPYPFAVVGIRETFRHYVYFLQQILHYVHTLIFNVAKGTLFNLLKLNSFFIVYLKRVLL